MGHASISHLRHKQCQLERFGGQIFMATRNNFFRAGGAAAARAPERKFFCGRIFGQEFIIKYFLHTAVIVFCLPLVGLAQTFVKPGDTGAIEFPIYSEATSFEAAEGVKILTNAPSFFIVKNTSILGPSSIQPAGTKNFVVDYEIGSDAQEGPFTVDLNVNMDSLNVHPDTATLTASVDFFRNFSFSYVG